MARHSQTSKQESSSGRLPLDHPMAHLTFNRAMYMGWASVEGCINVLKPHPFKYSLARISLNLRLGKEKEDFRAILKVLNDYQHEIEKRFPSLEVDDDPLLR